MKCAAYSFVDMPAESDGKRCQHCGKDDNCPRGCVGSSLGYSQEEVVEYGLEWGEVEGYGARHALRFAKEADTHEGLLAALDEAKAAPGVVRVRAHQPYYED
tara:strand:- start:1012 stop:1317 length:306 start_codon:yes stop_codon:yes gene_type:complete